MDVLAIIVKMVDLLNFYVYERRGAGF